MSNWYKDLKNKKYTLYDKEGCAATGQIICVKGNCDCSNCDYAEQFLKTGHRVDIRSHRCNCSSCGCGNTQDREKSLFKLLDEAEARLKLARETLDEVYNWTKSPFTNELRPKGHKWEKGNRNIHLPKEIKELKRQQNIILNNTLKSEYIVSGEEQIITDGYTVVRVRWDDGTTTNATVRKGDTYDYIKGVLICAGKKLVKKFNCDTLESLCGNSLTKFYYMMIMLLNQTSSGRSFIHKNISKGWPKI